MILLCKLSSDYYFSVLQYIERLADGTLLFIPDGNHWWEQVFVDRDGGPFQMIDWNGDNISDLVVSGRIFQRQPAIQSFAQREGVHNPFSGFSFAFGEPHLEDWDGDGVLDFLVYERNQTRPRLRVFVRRNGELAEAEIKQDHIPLVLNDILSGLQFLDWNGDGDADLVVPSQVVFGILSSCVSKSGSIPG
eukprot:s42_g5.t1